jgi:predicted GNAT family N-acyltransferase
VQVRIADFESDYEALRFVRFAVFVDEQRVPEAIEIDDRDAACIHALALGDDNEPIGTARIDIEARGKIGRLAVMAAQRRAGVGTALMRMLHDVAVTSGLTVVWCHAQRSAAPFYTALGYRVTSAPFLEAGIEHVRMERTLEPKPLG